MVFSGIDGLNIGDTVCEPFKVEPVQFVKIEEPTVEMTFSVNDSPFAGKEGKFVTTRQIRERLYKELLRDVSLRVNDTDSSDSFRVCGPRRNAPLPSLSRRCAAKATSSRYPRPRYYIKK